MVIGSSPWCGPPPTSTIIAVKASLLAVGLLFWTVGFLYNWSRPTLWIFDLLVIPVMFVIYSVGFVMVIAGLILQLRPRVAATTVSVFTVLAMLVNPLWQIAPRSYFLIHRPFLELALTVDPGNDLYGAKLPLPLQFLTSSGSVSSPRADFDREPSERSIHFFPQWIGIPDGGGGYLYSPEGSPKGVDLYGDPCVEPVDLGDGWWMCDMALTGF